MIILTDEEVAKLREALETTAFKSHDIAKREAALSVLDVAPTVEQVGVVAVAPYGQISVGWQIGSPFKHNTVLYARTEVK